MEYDLYDALKLLLAALLGGLIGLERESLNKSAGFRTHTLVSLGSCLITITSIEMFRMASGVADPGRIAAQIVSGIGFLGAGTIMRSGLGIKGLTTAASLWVVAGIGLAVGAGSFINAVITTGIVLLILIYMPKLEKFYSKKGKKETIIEVTIHDKPGQLGAITTVLGNMSVHIRNIEMVSSERDNRLIVTLTMNIPYCFTINDVVENLKKVQGVIKVSY